MCVWVCVWVSACELVKVRNNHWLSKKKRGTSGEIHINTWVLIYSKLNLIFFTWPTQVRLYIYNNLFTLFFFFFKKKISNKVVDVDHVGRERERERVSLWERERESWSWGDPVCSGHDDPLLHVYPLNDVTNDPSRLSLLYFKCSFP
jgi:hypothetical protein